jgi:hypothetical protein
VLESGTVYRYDDVPALATEAVFVEVIAIFGTVT